MKLTHLQKVNSNSDGQIHYGIWDSISETYSVLCNPKAHGSRVHAYSVCDKCMAVKRKLSLLPEADRRTVWLHEADMSATVTIEYGVDVYVLTLVPDGENYKGVLSRNAVQINSFVSQGETRDEALVKLGTLLGLKLTGIHQKLTG